MTERQAKRLARLLKSMDLVIDMMDHPDLRPLVVEWNGPSNLRDNLSEFVNWQDGKLRGREGAPHP